MGLAAAVVGGAAALGSAGIGFAGSRKASKAAAKGAKVGKESAKALERIRDQLAGGELFGFASEDFTGRRPDFAEFQRLDPGIALSDAAKASRGALGDIAGLTFEANSLNRLADAVRFQDLFPGGLEALRRQSAAASSLSGGELPFSDALGVVRNRAGLAQSLGIAGTQLGGALPRDLGLSRLQAIQTGAALTSQGAATLNAISPVSNQLRIQDNLLSGPQQVDLALRQNILEQQSEQARFNLEASPDPLAQSLLGLEKERLQLYSSGQLAAAQIQSANALATAQQQQNSLDQIAGLFGPGGALNGIFSGSASPSVSPAPGSYSFTF